MPHSHRLRAVIVSPLAASRRAGRAVLTASQLTPIRLAKHFTAGLRVPRAHRVRSVADAWQAVEHSVWDERRLDPPAVGRLSEIRVPTLVIAGLLDQPHTLQGCQMLAAGIAGARLVEYPDAAHMVTMERASEVTTLLLDFLG